VPQHVGGVVVAVGAEGLADDVSVGGVDGAAAEGTAVFAYAAVAAGTARFHSSVDRAEGRGGQGVAADPADQLAGRSRNTQARRVT
jgi:hypothetical protein